MSIYIYIEKSEIPFSSLSNFVCKLWKSLEKKENLEFMYECFRLSVFMIAFVLFCFVEKFVCAEYMVFWEGGKLV